MKNAKKYFLILFGYLLILGFNATSGLIYKETIKTEVDSARKTAIEKCFKGSTNNLSEIVNKPCVRESVEGASKIADKFRYLKMIADMLIVLLIPLAIVMLLSKLEHNRSPQRPSAAPLS